MTPYPYETATPEQRAIGAWWWCVHHEIHCEPLTEPVENRVKYVRENKASHEIATRLRELAPVLHPERLPALLVEARRARVEALRACDEAWRVYDERWRACANAHRPYDEAWRVYDETWRPYDEAGRAYDEARRACDEALRAYEPELMALHREEYPDTQWNGRSIFAERGES